MLKIRPLGDHIAVREIKPPHYSNSGIFIGPEPQDTGFVKEILRGEVVAVGPGRPEDHDMWGIHIGQVIGYSPVGSKTFDFGDGAQVTMIRRDAVVGLHPQEQQICAEIHP